MIISVVGIGQCGGRVVDKLVWFGKQSKGINPLGGIEIIRRALAANTDEADLRSLVHIKPHHRIVYGDDEVHGHGVGGDNKLGARLAQEDTKIMNAVKGDQDIYKADAFLVVASTAGGTGSGGMPVVVKKLKSQFDRPVYALAFLPFASQEERQDRCVPNTATCLKAVYEAADAVILVDNERFKLERNASLEDNLDSINFIATQWFYDLLRAGEERSREHIGSKTVDAGDIGRILKGWSAIGFGRVKLPRIELSIRKDLSEDAQRGVGALEKALDNLSFECDPAEAGGVLYLVSALKEKMDIKLVETIEKRLKKRSPQADIGGGDYPVEKRMIDITIILSQFGSVKRVKSFFDRYPEAKKRLEEKGKETQRKHAELADAAKDVPDLLGG